MPLYDEGEISIRDSPMRNSIGDAKRWQGSPSANFWRELEKLTMNYRVIWDPMRFDELRRIWMTLRQRERNSTHVDADRDT